MDITAQRKVNLEKALVELQLEKTLVELCFKYPEGLSQNKIVEELKSRRCSAGLGDIAGALNHLLRSGQLQLFRTDDQLSFRVVAQQEREKFSGLGAEERLIYQLIGSSQDRGMWTRDLRLKSNLQQTQVAKIIKLLEGRRLIKAVKSVAAKNRKVYMLTEIEPSRDVTGGAWYHEQDFDEDFIKVLHDQCCMFAVKQGKVSTEQVHSFVENSGIFKVELRLEDIRTVLDTLVYDGLLEEVGEGNGLFKPCKGSTHSTPYANVPCCLCPVINVCQAPHCPVCPEVCPYLDQWLNPVPSSF